MPYSQQKPKTFLRHVESHNTGHVNGKACFFVLVCAIPTRAISATHVLGSVEAPEHRLSHLAMVPRNQIDVVKVDKV